MNAEQIFGTIVGVISMIGVLTAIFKMFFYDNIKEMFGEVTKRLDNIDKKIEKLDEKVQDLDRRLCRMEGAFSARDFCGIRHNDVNKHAE